MVEIVDESFTSRFIKIKEQREKNTKKYFIYQKIGKKGHFLILRTMIWGIEGMDSCTFFWKE